MHLCDTLSSTTFHRDCVRHLVLRSSSRGPRARIYFPLLLLPHFSFWVGAKENGKKKEMEREQGDSDRMGLMLFPPEFPFLWGIDRRHRPSRSSHAMRSDCK